MSPAAEGYCCEPIWNGPPSAVMARLRDPQMGCEWDVAQTFSTIAPYTIEGAYEVADAIAREDLPALREELGDLLLQVVFHARMAEELGAFDFDARGARHLGQDDRRGPAYLRRRGPGRPVTRGALGSAEGGRAGGQGR